MQIPAEVGHLEPVPGLVSGMCRIVTLKELKATLDKPAPVVFKHPRCQANYYPCVKSKKSYDSNSN